jgi:hypothetical protein
LEGEVFGACSLVRNISGVEGHVGILGWGLGGWTVTQLLTRTCTNQATSWLMCSCSTLMHKLITSKHGFTKLTTT